MRTVLFIVICLLVVPVDGASRKNIRTAKKLVDKGLHYQKKNNHQEAINYFDQALDLYPHPKVEFFKAQSLQEIGQLEDALAIYTRIVDDAKVKKYRDEIQAAIESLKRQLAPLKVTIATGQYTGADVYINGAIRGKTPLNLTLAKGTYQVRITKPGFHEVEQDLDVRGTEALNLDISLTAVDVAPPKQIVRSEPPAADNTWAWVALGTGIVSAGIGTAVLVRYFVDNSNARPETADHYADNVPATNAIIGGVVLSAGVGLMITSIFLFSDDEPSQNQQIHALVPSVGWAHGQYFQLSYTHRF